MLECLNIPYKNYRRKWYKNIESILMIYELIFVKTKKKNLRKDKKE